MSVGRNELCPCGSGKKYKKCCGIVTPITQLQGSREQKLRHEYMNWIERFNGYISTQLSKEEMDQARERFSDSTGLTIEETNNDLWDVHFLNWFVFDVNRGKSTLIQDFVKQYGKRMDRTVQQTFLELSLGIYEIDEVEEEIVKAHNLLTKEEHRIIGANVFGPENGQLIIGRLLPLGVRDLLFSGSLIVQPGIKPALFDWLSGHNLTVADGQKTDLRAHTLDLYGLILQSKPSRMNTQPKLQDRLVRRVYTNIETEQLRKILEKQPSFEMKKRNDSEEIWVYSSRKEEFLFRSLNNTLLELHEVLGEVLIVNGQVWIEGFEDQIQDVEVLLQLENHGSVEEIAKLTSTGSKLGRGTIFITSQPTLPKKVLQWAVQTYFAEKWLVSPHPEIKNLPPLLAAAANVAELRDRVEHQVDKMEDEARLGVGAARFMRVEMLRPSLALPVQSVHIQNLLNRPLVQGLPDSSYTVQSKQLDDIALFVSEVTGGKSDATIKKYDEAMNLFRSFVRSAFGPEFTWDQLRREEVAYFLVQDVTERSDSLTKTLAANLLSVLSAFFKWVDKQYATNLSNKLQPLLGDMKEDLPEAYKLLSTLAKEASQNLHERTLSPQNVEETHMLVLAKQDQLLQVKLADGQTIDLAIGEGVDSVLDTDWMLAGLIGQAEDGTWHLYSAPKVYPPVISTLLGVSVSVLV
ncbi:YecA family protein [Brevibacillus ginsengisoli]|uniref:YecA family protein n=1 Tax=Brevibacillus ginsengisoli TaxID=363854 RepID=UPI003CFBB004